MESILGPHGWANPEALGEEKQLSLLDARKDIATWRQPTFGNLLSPPSRQAATQWRTLTQPDTLLQIVLNNTVGSEKDGKGDGSTETTRKSASK